MMTDKEAKEYLEAVVSKTAYAGKKKMEEDCQYLDIFGKCKATTQKTCRGCRFFNPTMPAKIRILAQYGLDRDAENNKLVDKIARKEDEIEKLKNELSAAKIIIDKVRTLSDVMRLGNDNADHVMFPVESQDAAASLMSQAIEIIEDLTGVEWEFSYLTY